jgi:alkyl sulfatase BDS1-like metallo-beta-lactamase superfamily hydrolase
MGLNPDELAETVRLPEHLASKPYLQEYYGTVAWSVRSIYDGYLGWFDETPSRLFPLSRKDLSKRMTNLAGGRESLLERAEESFLQGDGKWSLFLVEHLLVLDPADREARDLKARCMTRLAEQTNTATARNYLLTQVREMEGTLSIGKRRIKEAEVVQDLPLKAIFDAMTVSLDPDRSRDTDRVVAFHFPDTGQVFTLHVRRGVAEVRPFESEKPDLGGGDLFPDLKRRSLQASGTCRIARKG